MSTAAAMSSNDDAHLAAMGLLPAPAPQAPTDPLPGTVAARANALVIPVMRASMSARKYRSRRKRAGFAPRGRPATPKDRAFSLQVRRHKRMQFWHNSIQDKYFPLKIQRGELPLRKTKKLARRAERAANFAIGQAEARAHVLRKNGRKRHYAYYTLGSRRFHERRAESARQDAIGWAKVSQMLRHSARAASTRACFGL
ncbi:hypothetical protein LZ32DRAFT_663087 [Colletotrichum eremochloae]|nr:hypothetical protein LZ32DRAFT_663087 [Colletotrichum eremochloae]